MQTSDNQKNSNVNSGQCLRNFYENVNDKNVRFRIVAKTEKLLKISKKIKDSTEN